LVGRSTPVVQLKSLDLPAPLGPMMARISPDWIATSTLLRALSPPNRMERRSVRSITGGAAPPPVRAGDAASAERSRVTPSGTSRRAGPTYPRSGRPPGVDLLEPRAGVLVEPLVIGRVQRRVEDRNVPVDAGETFDLLAEGGQVGRLGDGAVAREPVLLGEAEVVGLRGQDDGVGA